MAEHCFHNASQCHFTAFFLSCISCISCISRSINYEQNNRERNEISESSPGNPVRRLWADLLRGVSLPNSEASESLLACIGRGGGGQEKQADQLRNREVNFVAISCGLVYNEYRCCLIFNNFCRYWVDPTTNCQRIIHQVLDFMNRTFNLALLFLFAFPSCSFLLGQDSVSPENGDRKSETSSVDPSVAKADVSKPNRLETGKSISRKYDFKEAEKEMEYQLFLPKTYYDEVDKDSKKSYPLILALHGYGSNPKQLLGYPDFLSNAEKNGYVVVAPMGYNSRGWYGSRGTKGGRGSGPKNLGELSEKDVMNVLKITRDDFQIDPNRIYIYGHSMGGGGALHLAIKFPETWAAIAPMAPATPYSLKDLEKAKQIPAIIVHGDADGVLPVKATRSLIEKMNELEIEHQYIEVKNGGHVLVAFQHWDEIFEFFGKHSKTQKSESDSQVK